MQIQLKKTKNQHKNSIKNNIKKYKNNIRATRNQHKINIKTTRNRLKFYARMSSDFAFCIILQEYKAGLGLTKSIIEGVA